MVQMNFCCGESQKPCSCIPYPVLILLICIAWNNSKVRPPLGEEVTAKFLC